MLPCFRGRLDCRLPSSISKRGDHARPRFGRHDHVVDVAAARGDVRVGEPLLVLVRQPRALRVDVRGRGELVAEDDVHRALDAHDRDARRRPGQVHVAADVLAAHDVVGAAVRLARDDRHLGHGRLGVRVQQLRAVANDAAVLLAHAGQEAGHVDEGQQRHVERVARAHETRRLVRGVDVQRAGQHRRLVRRRCRRCGRPGARSRR